MDQVCPRQLENAGEQNINKKKLLELIKKQNDRKQSEAKAKKKTKLVGYSSGEWNSREVKLYYRYLSSHKSQFTDPQLRKKNKVFIKLADFIGSRTPDQCRSHHQKATIRFPLFEDLLEYYKIRINEYSKTDEQEKEAEICFMKNISQSSSNKIEIEKEYELPELIPETCKVEIKKIVPQHQVNQISQQKQMCIQGKNDKVTGQIISKDYYSFRFSEQNKKILIQIDADKIQSYD